MLTIDLVRVRRSGGRLRVVGLRPAERQRLAGVAEHYVRLATEHLGRTRGELEASWRQVDHQPTDYKLLKGLQKLLIDRCTFAAGGEPDARLVRKTVFRRAARDRRAGIFDRHAVVSAAAAELGMAPEDLETHLFADLKSNQRLTEFLPISAAALLDAYQQAAEQAVLLRATRVVVHLGSPDPVSCRLFFNRLKFRRLLYVLERLTDGRFRITIDGPFSLFRSVTKYGLQLALVLPALQQAGIWQLDAEIRWGSDTLNYHLEANTAPRVAEPVRLADEVRRLMDAFTRLETPWRVAIAHELLDLPGVGLCVPDLAFVHPPTGTRVFLEVMGFWSRAAVWRRVELVEAGLGHPIIFAVSSRLRVSEEVLDAKLPGQLYVYKGVMRASAIAERLAAMLPPGVNQAAANS